MKFNKKIVKSTILLLTAASVLPLFYKTCSTTAMEALTVKPVQQNSITITNEDEKKFKSIISQHHSVLLDSSSKKTNENYTWPLKQRIGRGSINPNGNISSNIACKILDLIKLLKIKDMKLNITEISQMNPPLFEALSNIFDKNTGSAEQTIKFLEDTIWHPKGTEQYDKKAVTRVRLDNISKLIAYTKKLNCNLEQALKNSNSIHDGSVYDFVNNLNEICTGLLRDFDILQDIIIKDLVFIFCHRFLEKFGVHKKENQTQFTEYMKTLKSKLVEKIKVTFETYGISNVEISQELMNKLLQDLLELSNDLKKNMDSYTQIDLKNSSHSTFDSMLLNLEKDIENSTAAFKNLTQDTAKQHRDKFFRDKTDPLNLTDEYFRKPIIDSTVDLLKLIEDFNQKDNICDKIFAILNQKATNLEIEQRLPNFEAIVESLNNLIGKEKTKVNVAYLEDCLNLLLNWLQVVELVPLEETVAEKEQQTTKNSIQQEKEVENYSNNIKQLLPKIKSLYDNLEKLKKDLIDDIINSTCQYYLGSVNDNAEQPVNIYGKDATKYGKYNSAHDFNSRLMFHSYISGYYDENGNYKTGKKTDEFKSFIDQYFKSYVETWGIFNLEKKLDINISNCFAAIDKRERETTQNTPPEIGYTSTTNFTKIIKDKKKHQQLYLEQKHHVTKQILTASNSLLNSLTRISDFLKSKKQQNYNMCQSDIEKLINKTTQIIDQYQQIEITNAPVGIFDFKTCFQLEGVLEALKLDHSIVMQPEFQDNIKTPSYGHGIQDKKLLTNDDYFNYGSELHSWYNDLNLGYAASCLHEAKTAIINSLKNQIYIALFSRYEKQKNINNLNLLTDEQLKTRLETYIEDYLTKNLTYKLDNNSNLLINDLHSQCAAQSEYYDQLQASFPNLFNSLDDIVDSKKTYIIKNMHYDPVDRNEYMKKNNLDLFTKESVEKDGKLIRSLLKNIFKNK